MSFNRRFWNFSRFVCLLFIFLLGRILFCGLSFLFWLFSKILPRQRSNIRNPVLMLSFRWFNRGRSLFFWFFNLLWRRAHNFQPWSFFNRLNYRSFGLFSACFHNTRNGNFWSFRLFFFFYRLFRLFCLSFFYNKRLWLCLFFFRLNIQGAYIINISLCHRYAVRFKNYPKLIFSCFH